MIHPHTPDFENTPVAPNRARYSYALGTEDLSAAVSIVTPVYNIGSVFLETAQSLFQQSFQDFEWIIVDDGTSEAESLALLDRCAALDHRVKLVRHPMNLGLSAARNSGYRAAGTEFVMQIDGDDLLEPTAIEKYLWCLHSNPQLSFVSSLQVGFGANRYLYPGGFYDSAKFLEENRTDPTALVRRAVHQAVGGYDEKNRGGLEDWEFWLACAESGYWGYTIPEYLEWYRWSGSPRNKWANWDLGPNQQSFQRMLLERYPRIFGGAFPVVDLDQRRGARQVRDPSPFQNLLRPRSGRILVLAESAADINTAELLGEWGDLVGDGQEITFCFVLDSSLEHEWPFSVVTPDVFTLSCFLPQHFQIAFLSYLLRSRGCDQVVVWRNSLSYLLAFLQRQFPAVRWVDYSTTDQVSATTLRQDLRR